MTLEEIEAIFFGELGLVFDTNERGVARTYFLEKVRWEPIRNTRIVRVAYDSLGKVTSIRLCVSSDNNNSIFVTMPVTSQELKKIIAAEIAAWRQANVLAV